MVAAVEPVGVDVMALAESCRCSQSGLRFAATAEANGLETAADTTAPIVVLVRAAAKVVETGCYGVWEVAIADIIAVVATMVFVLPGRAIAAVLVVGVMTAAETEVDVKELELD